MSDLNQSLERWTKANLLTAEQAEQIRAFEDARPVSQPDSQPGSLPSRPTRRPWALYGIVAIGVTAIAIGLVSIVAANWGSIPAAIKLGAYLALQFAAAVTAWRFLDRPGPAREAALALYALLFFAGIGLTAQIFHLTSNGYGALFFWAVLALPAMLLVRSRWLVYLWLIDVLIAHAIWLGVRTEALSSREPHTAMLLIFLSLLTLYLYLAAGVFRRDSIALPRFLGEAMRALPILILLFGGSILGTILWYFGGKDAIDEIGKDWVVVRHLRWAPWVGASMIVPALLLRRPRISPPLVIAITAVFFALAALVTFPLMFAAEQNRVIGTLLLVLVWGLAATAAALADRRRLFDLLTLAIAIRLLVVYFEVFGSLMATGIGLIFSGILILAVAWAWIKFRGRLASWVRGLGGSPA